MLAAGGCATSETRLQPVDTIVSPYGHAQVWAVAPLANESGISIIEIARFSDLVGEEMQRVAGIDVIPLNRVLAAMRELEMDRVTTAGHVRQLMNVLELDGMVIGTITAYDPYRPLKLGMALQLFTQDAAERYDAFDPRMLTLSGSGEIAPGGLSGERPAAAAAGVFDATHHDTVARLEAYAASRSEPDSAFGPEIYLVRMELFAQFVSDQLIRAMLQGERARMGLTEDNATVR